MRRKKPADGVGRAGEAGVVGGKKGGITRIPRILCRKETRSVLARQCDILWSRLIRKRDGDICQRCRRPGNNPHHIFSRKHRSTRWSPDNGLVLCFACHRHFAHGDYEAFRDFIVKRMGQDAFDRLKVRAYMPMKVDLVLAKMMLNKLLEEA